MGRRWCRQSQDEEASGIKRPTATVAKPSARQQGFRRRFRPALGRHCAHTGKSMLKRTRRPEAQLTPRVRNIPAGNCRTPRLRPLATADGRCQVSFHVGCPLHHFLGERRSAVHQPAENSSKFDENGAFKAAGLTNIAELRLQPRQRLEDSAETPPAN